jgi:catechol 2,3-dioxygenase-like lactoylglutathione lyase family enzyme
MKINGVHHLAISTTNMKGQIEFFTEVMGMELVALYWMHGVKDAWHGFLKLNDHSYLAFVQMPKNADGRAEIGHSHAAGGGGPSAGGTMQHVSFNVDTLDELLEMRDRLRTNGVPVFGPLDHGMCHSIYFAGPEGLNLEVATSEEAIDRRLWIDPEVTALAGMSAEDVARYTAPKKPVTVDSPVPQPAFDATKPHIPMPKEVYEKVLAMSDEDYSTRFSVPEPPIKL